MPKVHKQIVRGKVYWRVIVPKNLSEKRKTKFFKSKNVAEIFADSIEQDRVRGSGFYQLSPQDQALLMSALNRIGSAASLHSAVDFWLAQRPREITLTKLIGECVEEKRRAGATIKHIADLDNVLNRFARGREQVPAHKIEPSDISQWLHSSSRLSAIGRQTYLRKIRTLFSYAVTHRYRLDNPAMKVEVPRGTEDEIHSIGILTPDQAEQLMRSAEREDPKLILFLALCLFGGLRPSEAAKIVPGDISDRHITVLGKRSGGTRRRRLVTINDTLRAWLVIGGDFAPIPKLAHRSKRARKWVPWSHDCLRHSFVSYHYAIHGAATTAREAGHSEAVLFAHYRELVTLEAAEKFWKIKPINYQPLASYSEKLKD